MILATRRIHGLLFPRLSKHAAPRSLFRLFSSSDYGVGMDQEALMESDYLIAVDLNDTVVDTKLTKRQGHTFSETTPRAILHRAFSFFLFDANAKLLLTQRADNKITFPGVWTNTCCSHPLQGMPVNEVDHVSEAYPNFAGIKRAATRKVKHELGIDEGRILHSDIQFITRFHYWAADTVTYGATPPWGEHEIDYILFYQTQQPVRLNLNPEEVSDYKYVSAQELKDMMREPGLLWSPWFLGIMERGGFEWWDNLEASLAGKYTNQDIVYFDPPSEHFATFNLPSHGRETGVLL